MLTHHVPQALGPEPVCVLCGDSPTSRQCILCCLGLQDVLRSCPFSCSILGVADVVYPTSP